MRNEVIDLLVQSNMLTNEQGEYIKSQPKSEIKNGRLDTYNEAQLAIYLGIGLVELIGADVELTNAVCDLQNALNRLTKFLIQPVTC